MASKVTPSQTVGPFFHYALPWKDGHVVAGAGAEGARIVIEGRVLDGGGAPVTDAMIEIWQADAHGRYAHVEDRQDKPLSDGFTGFGRTETDEEGRFRFETVKPGRVPGPGNALQAPHIAVSVFARGLLDRLVTRIYFADERAANEEDPVLGLIDDPAARETLLASAQNGTATYRFDIRLQGEDETVFFEV